jgi:hypothetical protein
MSFKGLQKFTKYLLRCLPAFNNSRMLLRVIDIHNIFNLNLAISIFIKLLKSLQDESHSIFAHFTSDLSDELLIVDVAITIEVK